MKYSFRNNSVVLISAILIFGGLGFYGCESDDPASPPTPTTGQITIECTPDDISIPWTLIQPGGLTASGLSDSTLTDMSAGDYSLTWGAVVGWNLPSPNPATASLMADSAIGFSGTYTTAIGTIVVNPVPYDINAPWQLSGPEGYVIAGAGNMTLNDLVVGNYSIEWGVVADWNQPNPNILSQYLGNGEVLSFDGLYFNSFVHILIPPTSVPMPTTFTMGSTVYSDETPHQVTLTGRFKMASTVVTNAQYVSALQWAFNQGHVSATSSSVRDNLDGSTQELLDLYDSNCQISVIYGVFSTSNPDHPVVEVTWYGAVAYCDWLSLQQSLPRAYDHSTWSCNSGNPYTASGYRLPTEAEWEFACRAGTTTPFNTGDCLDAGSEANYRGTNPYTSCPSGPDLGHTVIVGSYPANQWGLFEIHGNVCQWCNDWCGTYSGNETDPGGAASGNYRVLRGGSWGNVAYNCRSARRFSGSPSASANRVGFRPVRSTQ